MKECVDVLREKETENVPEKTTTNVYFLFIRAATDHNIDNTTALMHEWLSKVEKLYHSVQLQTMEEEIRCL